MVKSFRLKNKKSRKSKKLRGGMFSGGAPSIDVPLSQYPQQTMGVVPQAQLSQAHQIIAQQQAQLAQAQLAQAQLAQAQQTISMLQANLAEAEREKAESNMQLNRLENECSLLYRENQRLKAEGNIALTAYHQARPTKGFVTQ